MILILGFLLGMLLCILAVAFSSLASWFLFGFVVVSVLAIGWAVFNGAQKNVQ